MSWTNAIIKYLSVDRKQTWNENKVTFQELINNMRVVQNNTDRVRKDSLTIYLEDKQTPTTSSHTERLTFIQDDQLSHHYDGTHPYLRSSGASKHN